MQHLDPFCTNSLPNEESCLLSTWCFDSNLSLFPIGGLFLDPTIRGSLFRLIPSTTLTAIASKSVSTRFSRREANFLWGFQRGRDNTHHVGDGFLSISFRSQGLVTEPKVDFEKNGVDESNAMDTCDGDVVLEGKKEKKQKISKMGGGAMNSSKHHWAGAIAAMVSRYPCMVACFLYLVVKLSFMAYLPKMVSCA